MGFALLRDELLSRGYTYIPATPDKNYKQYVSPNGKFSLTKTGHYDYPFVSESTTAICRDKTRSYDLVDKLGLSIPRTLQTFGLEPAKEFLDTYKRVIVKPVDSRGSKGLTLNITNHEQLEEAISHASINQHPPLIQEQFIGEEIRFTVIDGKVQSAILRRSPRLTGDGSSTVAQLIEAENKVRETLVFPLLTYPQLTDAVIPKEYFTDTRIPANGEVVELSNSTMIRGGASFYGILNEVHESYIRLVEELASKVSPAFLVVDLMVKQWKSPVQPTDYVFLEFNTDPGLVVYTSLRGGDTPDVIAKVADLLDTYAV